MGLAGSSLTIGPIASSFSCPGCAYCGCTPDVDLGSVDAAMSDAECIGKSVTAGTVTLCVPGRQTFARCDDPLTITGGVAIQKLFDVIAKVDVEKGDVKIVSACGAATKEVVPFAQVQGQLADAHDAAAADERICLVKTMDQEYWNANKALQDNKGLTNIKFPPNHHCVYTFAQNWEGQESIDVQGMAVYLFAEVKTIRKNEAGFTKGRRDAIYSIFLAPAEAGGAPTKKPIWKWIDSDGGNAGGQLVKYTQGDEPGEIVGAIKTTHVSVAKGMDAIAALCIMVVWRERRDCARNCAFQGAAY